MFYKILLILFGVGFGIKFDLIGTISLSEIFLISTSFLYIKKKNFLKFPILKNITWLYVGLLFSQIISEIFIGNSVSNALKGFAVTIVSYLHFMFLFSSFIKSRNTIIYILIGSLLNLFIFGSEIEGDFNRAISGEEAGYLKFYIAPIISNILLIISIFVRKKTSIIIFIFIGALLVILGARSAGILILLTGLLGYFIIFNKQNLNLKKIARISILLIFLSYGLYIFYVNNVLSGKIESGNSQQLKNIENPYNPLNLLIFGRTETFVGAIAFMDKPFFGHGSWTKDFDNKYHILFYKFKNDDFYNYKFENINEIPSHSVLIGMGMYNGFLAFFFTGYIFYFFIKYGFKSLNRFNLFIFILIFFIFSIIWNGLFSPMSHFRINLPLPFAFLLSSFLIQNNKHNQ